MLFGLVRALGTIGMTILIFIGVVLAVGVGVLLSLIWSALQFAALGLVATVAVVFTVGEAFRHRKSPRKGKSSDKPVEADQSP